MTSYKQPNRPDLPKKNKIETFESNDFNLKYPNTWETFQHENPKGKFVGVPMTAEGVFKENLIIVILPIDGKYKKLSKFVEYVSSSLDMQYKSFKIISNVSGKTDGFKYQDVVYSMEKDLGYSAIKLKSWTRYFFNEKSIYQITYTSEKENYDSLFHEVLDIVNSIEMK